MKVTVARYSADRGETGYNTFDVPHRSGMTVLDALFHIQEALDDSIAFRYSCRGAVCGSCAMLINKVPRLACRTQMLSLFDRGQSVDLVEYAALDTGRDPTKEEILVEPLPHLPVIRDLIVDMLRFYKYYRLLEPHLQPAGDPPELEYRMETSVVHELEPYTNCILCGACYGACPVCGEKEAYKGPAALAKLYRFYLDPRDADKEKRLLLADDSDGWWACKFYTNCNRVCPKDVPPHMAIGEARYQLQQRSEEAPEE